MKKKELINFNSLQNVSNFWKYWETFNLEMIMNYIPIHGLPRSGKSTDFNITNFEMGEKN